VKVVGEQRIQPLLSDRRMRGEIDHRPLSRLAKPKRLVGVQNQQMREKVSLDHFAGQSLAHSGRGAKGGDIEGNRLRRAVVVEEMVRKDQSRASYRLRAAQSFANRLNQRELQYITDRHTEAQFSSMSYEEFGSIAARFP